MPRAAWRWARLLAPTRRATGMRVFYGHDRRARSRASRSPAGRRSSSGSRAASRTDPTTSRCSTSGSTWLPRDLGALLRLARRRGVPVVVNQDGVAYPGWAGDATDELNRPLPPRTARGRPRALPEPVQQGVVRSLPRRAARLLGGAATTRSTSNDFTPPASAPRRRAGAAARRRPDAGVPARVGASHARAFSPERAAARHRAARLAIREPLVRRAWHRRPRRVRRPLRTERRAGSHSPGASAAAHEGQGPVPERLSSRRWPADCRSSIRRAAAPSSSSATRPGSASRIPDTWERDEPPPPEALAEAVVRVHAGRAAYSSAARRRAVERFALEPWLERHAQLFAELAG